MAASSCLLSYDALPCHLPVIVEPIAEGDTLYVVLHPDMPTDFEELRKSWIQLKEERDTFEAQFYANEKKVLELTWLLHEERNINAYIAQKRMCLWEALVSLLWEFSFSLLPLL